ncbi:MAG TPA: DUF169 domain-containing protein [Vicinamibacterales bacterium]|jgi:uncharacterized protein (DUF169 family)|nr:DUF169 domain-containing protein [Vicinamibacterales bacterium]
MTDYSQIERRLTDVLRLSRRPVAIAFRDTPPEGVLPLTGSQPSSCSFWRLAAAGNVFYTVPSDHFNCPVGSFTHNITLPPERESELKDVLAMMWEIGYIKMEDIPAISRLPVTPAVTVYAPLSQTPVAPDAVLIAGTPAKLMLLHEAATRAAKTVLPLLGRPTCMAIPAALSGGVASSLGCIGNRVYTGITDEQFYTVIAGSDLDVIAEELDTIVTANAKLAEFHLTRRATLASA